MPSSVKVWGGLRDSMIVIFDASTCEAVSAMGSS
jgi:hypothetical protein